MATTEQYIGQRLLRKEDAKLLAGEGSYIDNQSMAGIVAASPAAVLRGGGARALPMVWPNTEDIKVPTHYPLAADKVRFAGDAVAVVVAATREQAEDAAEAVSVRASALPAVIDLEDAASDRVVIHEDLGTNKVTHWSHGGAGDQNVFDTAPVIVQERYTQPRLIPNAIEARGCLAYGSPAAGEFTLVSATQIPHIARVGHSIATGIPQNKLRIIAPDVGGGFGSKVNVYAEEG